MSWSQYVSVFNVGGSVVSVPQAGREQTIQKYDGGGPQW